MVLAALLAVTSSGCATFTVRQSALVPAAVLPNAGHRDGVINLHVSDSTVTFLSRPERAPNSDAGLWVTRHLFQAGLSTRLGEHVAIRLNGLYGLSEGAMKAAPTTLQNPNLNTFGIGGGWDLRLNEESHHLNLTLDFRLLSIPTFFEATCINSACAGDRIGRRREAIFQATAALTYGFDFDPMWRGLFAMAVLNHPTNVEEFASSTASSDVDAGPLNLLIGMGVDVTVADGLGVIPMIQWPVTRDPVIYGPILSLAVRGTIADPSRREP